jgi:Protein of unknown function (DUF3592)
MFANKSPDFVLTLIGALFLALGIALLLGSAIVYQRSNAFMKTALPAEGRVIDMVRQQSNGKNGRTSTSYAAVIEFRDKSGQRQEFIDSISSQPARFAIGEAVPVVYDPEHPNTAATNDKFGRWGTLIILIPLALIFAGVGGGITGYLRHKDRRRKNLVESGTVIMSEFMHVEQNISLTVNGRHPYQVVTQAKNPFSGKLEQYRSDNLWIDPTSELTGRKIPVRIDPNTPGLYFVDLSGFDALAVE